MDCCFSRSEIRRGLRRLNCPSVWQVREMARSIQPSETGQRHRITVDEMRRLGVHGQRLRLEASVNSSEVCGGVCQERIIESSQRNACPIGSGPSASTLRRPLLQRSPDRPSLLGNGSNSTLIVILSSPIFPNSRTHHHASSCMTGVYVLVRASA